jgi:hypothetical protein
MGQNSAQRPTHSDAQPSPWPQHSGAHGPLAELAHGLRDLPAGTVCSSRTYTGAVTVLRARVVAWPVLALPWLRWGARASMVEGPPVGQMGDGGSSPKLLADGKGGKIGTATSRTRWVLWWPVWSYVGVGRKRGLGCNYTRRKRRLGGA